MSIYPLSADVFDLHSNATENNKLASHSIDNKSNPNSGVRHFSFATLSDFSILAQKYSADPKTLLCASAVNPGITIRCVAENENTGQSVGVTSDDIDS